MTILFILIFTLCSRQITKKYFKNSAFHEKIHINFIYYMELRSKKQNFPNISTADQRLPPSAYKNWKLILRNSDLTEDSQTKSKRRVFPCRSLLFRSINKQYVFKNNFSPKNLLVSPQVSNEKLKKQQSSDFALVGKKLTSRNSTSNEPTGWDYRKRILNNSKIALSKKSSNFNSFNDLKNKIKYKENHSIRSLAFQSLVNLEKQARKKRASIGLSAWEM